MFKEFSLVAFGQGIAFVGALILVRVLTEYLPPEEYGYLALSLTFVGLVNQVIMGGITVGIGRFYTVAKQESALKSFSADIAKIFFFATAVVLVLGSILIVGLFLAIQIRWIPLALFAIAFAILSAFNGVLNSIQNSARQRFPVAFHSALDVLLKIIFVIFFANIFDPNEVVIMGAYCIALLIVVTSQLIMLKSFFFENLQDKNFSGEWMKKIWAFAWPFSFWGIFTWVQQSSDRWALEHYVSSSEVGEYAVLFQIGYTPIVLAVGIISSYLGPILYQKSGSYANQWKSLEVHNITLKIVCAILLFTVVIAVIVSELHPWIFRLIVSVDYRSKSNLLPWMVLSGGVFAASQMLAMKFISEMRSKDLTVVKILTAIFGAIINIIGVILAGLDGAVFGLVAFSFCNFFYMFFLSGKKYQIRNGVNGA